MLPLERTLKKIKSKLEIKKFCPFVLLMNVFYLQPNGKFLHQKKEKNQYFRCRIQNLSKFISLSVIQDSFQLLFNP